MRSSSCNDIGAAYPRCSLSKQRFYLFDDLAQTVDELDEAAARNEHSRRMPVSCDWLFRRYDISRRSCTCGIIVIPLSGGPPAMANLLVRNLDDDVLKELKAAAKAHGRSLQAEIHEVLRNASARRRAQTRRLSARWLKRLRGSTQSDSAALIREDRDTR